MWKNPLGWDRKAEQTGERHRVFCASMADVFEDWQGPMLGADGERIGIYRNGTWQPSAGQPVEDWARPATMDDVRRRLAKLITATPNLDWLLLTKRTENAREMLYRMWFQEADWPRNYWLGTTVEDRASLRRIDLLRKTPAPIRFLSLEPLIEDLGDIDLAGIDWVIVGGESGPHARPFDLAWARSIRDQCQAQGVACFIKQLGSRPIGPWGTEVKKGYGPIQLRPGYAPLPIDHWRLKDSHGGDWDEWPEDLRVRDFPAAKSLASDLRQAFKASFERNEEAYRYLAR